jgi:hypothetical protein
VIARKSAADKHAEAMASVDDPQFTKHAVRVLAAPNQRVTGSWTVVCRESAGNFTRDADDFSGKTPLTVQTKPVTQTNSTCTFVGVAKMSGSGRVRVALLGR